MSTESNAPAGDTYDGGLFPAPVSQEQLEQLLVDVIWTDDVSSSASTIQDFLAQGESDPDRATAMHQAWFKAVTVSVVR